MKHYDYLGAAGELGLPSPNWLEEHKTELPHREFGKYIRFSEADIDEISEMFAVRPVTTAPPSIVPASLIAITPGRAPRKRRPS